MRTANCLSPLFGRILCAAAVILVLGGCAGDHRGSTVHVEKPLGTSGSALLTSADVRMIASTRPGLNSLPGRVSPEQITCIEPSPDIAKAVHESFNLGGSLGLGGLPSGVTADVAFAFAKARAEAVAQMTERLATIQLLRDGLYRACEAYANGAISDTTYSVLLSRYDDTMVTLLMGELAAGNFGRQLASLSGGAGGSSSALVKKAVADQEAADNAATDTEEADAVVAQRNQELGAARARLEATPQDSPDRALREQEVATAEQSLTTAEAQRDLLKGMADQLLSSAASSRASAFAQSAGGAAAEAFSAQDRGAIAGKLADMQRKYIENINSDALIVACISALDRVAPEPNQNLIAQFKVLEEANNAWLAHRAQADVANSSGVDPGGKLIAAPLDPTNVKSREDQDRLLRAEILQAAQGLAGAAAVSNLSPLASYCLSGLLPQVMGGYQDILKILKSRSFEVHHEESIEDAFETVKGLKARLEALETTKASGGGTQ